jgi:hypothetical protein
VGIDLSQPRPFHIGLEPNPPVLALATLTYVEQSTDVSPFMAAPGVTGASLDMVVTGWDGTYVEGTFTATLVDQNPAGAPPIGVTNGRFRVKAVTGR